MWSDDSDVDTDRETPAVLKRPTVANHIVHERVQVDTQDHEDHTFCGIVFDVKCTDLLPIEFVEISSVAVRGGLGPMTVWTTPDTFRGKTSERNAMSHWRQIYKGSHSVSFRELVPFELEDPVRLGAGDSCGIFVHSRRSGDQSVVYDNQRHTRRPGANGEILSILPGMAALDNEPFGQMGMWGEGWRHRREFVGRLAVGVCWRLWNPECHRQFPSRFRSAVKCLLLCASKQDCVLHSLSDAVIFYILNMCRWDWFGDAMQAPEQEPEPAPFRPIAFQRRRDFHYDVDSDSDNEPLSPLERDWFDDSW